MFRVTGKDGERPAEEESNKDKAPILIQHGVNGSAKDWVGEDFGLPWALQLVNKGYDIWLGNNRGSIYSNTHEKDGNWTAAERWNFTYADMGKYDVRA